MTRQQQSLLRLRLLIGYLLAVALIAGLLHRRSFTERDAVTQKEWQLVKDTLESIEGNNQIVFMMGSSVVKLGFEMLSTCDVNGKPWTFVNLGKPHLDHRSYLQCGIYDALREEFPEALVWHEARSFFLNNYSDWPHGADFGTAIKNVFFDQIHRQLDLEAIFLKNRTAPHRRPGSPNQSGMKDGVISIDSTTVAHWGVAQRSYANKWRAKRDLALLQNGLVDAFFEFPTCPATRAKNVIPDAVELPNEPLRKIRQLQLPFLRENGEGLFYVDYEDPGHMNRRGRRKMQSVLCRWAHEFAASTP